MTKQYKYMRKPNCSDEEMNKLGFEGWECYHIMPTMPDSDWERTYFFKMEIQKYLNTYKNI